MQCLLDTCTFLWLIEDSRHLSPQVRSLLVESANTLFVSSVSAWEVAVKHSAGKLPLPLPLDEFLTQGRAGHRLQALPFAEQCAFHLPKLPSVHRDPFDWMLICQAIEHDLVLLTPDPMIRKYPIKTLW
ncbi:MAG: type II toxin-antitoxin system VapC family toxin [Panacagrimonas sp.]